MGTHPIFESDFDCLTDKNFESEMSLGIPIKVLHEAEGHVVTCESSTGEVYRGKLVEAEEHMNLQMQDVTATYRNGSTAQLVNIYIRGTQIKFMILPEMLKNAPMLKVAMRGQSQGAKPNFWQAGRGRGRPGGARGGRGGGPGAPRGRY